jgi:hypothetical protein
MVYPYQEKPFRKFSTGQNGEDNLSLLLVISSRVAGRNLTHAWEDFLLSLEMTNYHGVCLAENPQTITCR